MSASEDKNKNKNKPVNKNTEKNNTSISNQAVDSIIQKIGHAESRGQMYDKKTGKIIQNPNGSAKGPFQIVNKTWGGIEKQLGRKLKRDNWEDNVLAMKHLSKVYINRLEKAGLPVTDSNLYMLHFLGDTGGTSFLKKLKDNPNELASNYVSADAFQKNINVFVDKNTGETRTAAEVYTEMNSRLNDGKGDNAYKPEVKQNNVPVDNLEQFRSQQNFGEQDYNQQTQESTRTQQPRIDPSLNQPNQFAPKKVADNSVPENNPVAAPKMGLGMSGSLDYLPKDFGLAFLSDEELQQQEEEQLGQDVNMARNGGEINNSALRNKIKGAFTRNNNRFDLGGELDSDPPKKKPIYVTDKNDPRYIAYNDSLILHNHSEKQRAKGTNNKKNYILNGKDSDVLDSNQRAWYQKTRDQLKGKFFPNSEVGILIQGEDDRKKPKSLENDYNNDEYFHPDIKPTSGYNWSSKTGLGRLLESNDNFLYKKPEQPVEVKKPNTTTGNKVKEKGNKGMVLNETLMSKEEPRQKVQGLNTSIAPAGIQSQNQPIQGEGLQQRNYAQIPTSYDVNSQRYNMQGENPYYNFNAENTDYETALRAKLSAENYNADIERRYGNEEALKNPKAVERLKQLRQEVNITPNNFEQGGQMRTTNKEGLLNEFNEGGRHEENRYGGIPQGQGDNGQMNTVEEGETKIGGYVLSDTLKLNDNDIKSLFLPKEIKSGMTFAEASKVVNDYLKEDPNNKILKKTVNKHIDSLTLGNEKARLAKEKLDLAMQQEMNPEMDLNQEMQLGEEFDQNQMFLGGEASYEEMGMPGLSQGTKALTSLMAGDTDSAISGGLSAAGSIGGTLIGGPIGGAIGGAIGEGIGGLINGIGSGNKRRDAENSQHIIESNKFNNDFRCGGPDGEQPFPVNGEGYSDDLINKYPNRKNKINFEEPYEINVSDDLDSIENLKSKETYIPQGPYKLSGNFDAKPFDSNKAGIEYDANKERLRKEALEKDNANALGKNPLQYAPILGNALSYLEAKNDKPSVINSGRIDQRFNPRYADERTLQNTVGSELNNTTNALSSATNGSEGALRSNILGAGLNKAKAMSDAYMNIDNINRGQDNEADKFNYGVNAGNREAGYRDTIFNEGSKSATKDREISARNRLFDSIGGVGREITYDNRLKNMTEYDSMGRYSPQIQSKILEMQKIEEEEKKKNNTKRNGGFFSSMLDHSFENNKLSQAEIEFRKKYQ